MTLKYQYWLYFSYRENSADDKTDDDDVLEWTQPEKEEAEGPPAETIEKILKRRVGRKMGMVWFIHSIEINVFFKHMKNIWYYNDSNIRFYNCFKYWY